MLQWRNWLNGTRDYCWWKMKWVTVHCIWQLSKVSLSTKLLILKFWKICYQTVTMFKFTHSIFKWLLLGWFLQHFNQFPSLSTLSFFFLLPQFFFFSNWISPMAFRRKRTFACVEKFTKSKRRRSFRWVEQMGLKCLFSLWGYWGHVKMYFNTYFTLFTTVENCFLHFSPIPFSYISPPFFDSFSTCACRKIQKKWKNAVRPTLNWDLWKIVSRRS